MRGEARSKAEKRECTVVLDRVTPPRYTSLRAARQSNPRRAVTRHKKAGFRFPGSRHTAERPRRSQRQRQGTFTQTTAPNG